MSEYLIGVDDMAMIYVSPDPYSTAFEEEIDLLKFDLSIHRTAGLCFFRKMTAYSLLLWPQAPLEHEFQDGGLAFVAHG